MPDCSHERRPPLPATHPDWLGHPAAARSPSCTAADPANISLRLATGGAPRRLTGFSDKEINGDGGPNVAWSPDGKQLIVTRRSVSSDIVRIKNFR